MQSSTSDDVVILYVLFSIEGSTVRERDMDEKEKDEMKESAAETVMT